MWLERTRFAALPIVVIVTLETIAIMAVLIGPAAAHEARPAIIDVTPVGPDDLAIRVVFDAAGFLARADGADHDDFDNLSASALVERLNERFDALESAITLIGPEGPLLLAMKGVGRPGVLELLAADLPVGIDLELVPSETLGAGLVRQIDPSSGEPISSAFAEPGESAAILAQRPAQTVMSVARTYLVAGFDHIIPKGLDHILFVVGLFLLSPAIRPLLVQVGLFTVAHTATLGLAASGVLAVPATIVEPLIAASIAFIAFETIKPGPLSRWRPFVIFGFGLLHGLGFASVLADFGLPAEQFAVALVAFNFGVEAGQIAVLGLCFLSVGLFLGRPWYRRAISIPASLMLACIGVYWFAERISGGLA